MPVDSVLFINGSPSWPSRTAALCEHVAGELRGFGFTSTTLALRDLPPEPLLMGKADAPGIREAVAQVASAPAIALVTPIYKAAYSGLTKVFLDLLPQFALAGKIVLPLANAGSLAHVLALDYALRPVLSALGALQVTAGFVVLEQQLSIGPDGVRLDPDTASKLRPVLQTFVESARRHAD